MELLVVMAITAILMLILFIPLSKSLDLVHRGQAKVEGQGAVMAAMRRVTRDLSNAMEVYDPAPINIYGYSGAWSLINDRPQPSSTAAPQAYAVTNGRIAFRLPKHRWWCEQAQHYVAQADIGAGLPYDAVALDSCPRHPGSPLELRPLSPLEPDDRITAYFIGLKNPVLQVGGNSGPYYDNLVLFGFARGQTNLGRLNTYALYRVEFDPRGVVNAAANTNTDGNTNGLDDRYETFLTDPNFFYDTTSVTVTVGGQTRTQPRWQWWKDLTVTVMSSEVSDVIKWVEGPNNTFIPQPLVGFSPSGIVDEVAQPNRESGAFQIGQDTTNPGTNAGSIASPDVAPLEYKPDHGNWIGVQSDGNKAIPDGTALGPVPAGGVQLGPRIQILDGGSVAFDSQGGPRNREVAYDSLTGRVVLGMRRQDGGATGALVDSFSATVDASGASPTFTADLKQDTAQINGMPGGFGSAGTRYTSPTAQTRIVPSSEVVQRGDFSGSPPVLTNARTLRRVGWTGLSTTADRPVAQVELGPDEYAIDYTTGIITLHPDAATWTGVGPNQNTQLLVRYHYQTNKQTDVVRVGYATKELAAVKVGVVEYTRRSREVLPYEVSQQVLVRNLKR